VRSGGTLKITGTYTCSDPRRPPLRIDIDGFQSSRAQQDGTASPTGRAVTAGLHRDGQALRLRKSHECDDVVGIGRLHHRTDVLLDGEIPGTSRRFEA